MFLPSTRLYVYGTYLSSFDVNNDKSDAVRRVEQ